MTFRRRFASCLAFGLTSVLATVPALAQEQSGYAVSASNPAERGSQWFQLDSLDLRGNGRLAIGLVNDYSYRTLMVFKPSGSVDGSLVRNSYTANLGAAVVLADRVRVGLNVPLQLFVDGNRPLLNGTLRREAEGVAVGDVRVSADVRLLGTKTDAATVAIGGEMFLPSGSRAAYNGDGEPRFSPRVLFAGQTSGFVYAAKAGMMIRARDEAFLDGYIGHSLVYGASAGVMLDEGRLVVGPELYGSTVVSDGRAFEKRTTPVELLLGAHWDVASTLRVGAGVGTALAPGYGAGVARGMLSLDWVPGDAKPEAPKDAAKAVADRDGDGVPDDADACSYAAGSQSDDPAKNGCPEPPPPAPPPPPPCPACEDTDRDKDGVINSADACPDQAGTPDADPKKNGCPKAFLDKGVIRITEQVRFRTNSADIDPGKESLEVLEAILGVLKAHPEIASLRIEGHTDDRGDAAKNKQLSQARAEAVVNWLVGKGIEKSKLKAAGIGAEKPIETNATEAGRAANRRVELHVEQGSGQ